MKRGAFTVVAETSQRPKDEHRRRLPPKESSEPQDETSGAPDAQHDVVEYVPILCARCEAELTDREALFIVSGDSAFHVFANPAGILHEIVTLRRVRNVTETGPATAEFSWFPGYAWTVLNCGSCQNHVGWAFEGDSAERSPRHFFALRCAALRGL